MNNLKDNEHIIPENIEQSSCSSSNNSVGKKGNASEFFSRPIDLQKICISRSQTGACHIVLDLDTLRRKASFKNVKIAGIPTIYEKENGFLLASELIKNL